MGKPVVILFTLTNKAESLTYSIYALKAYVLQKMHHRPKPEILLQVYKVDKESYEEDQVSLKVTAREIAAITSSILEKHPKIVGFSCNVINRKALLSIAKRIKKADPSVTVIFGGPEMHQYYFQNGVLFCEAHPEADVIALFEGERILLELIESLLYGKDALGSIKGIIYRDGKRVIRTPDRQPEDLSLIPSPFLSGVYPIRNKGNEIIVENSRGCPYRCAYCSFPIGNNRFLRYFPVTRIKDELKYLLNKKIRYLTISDSNFNINKKQTEEILKTIIRHNKGSLTKIRVFFNASREVLTKEYLELLARSGIRLVIGVQSVNRNTLKTANRFDNLHILERNLKQMDCFGVNYSLEFIFGLPGDTYDDIKNDIDWLFRFNAQMVFFYRLVMIPGTYFYSHAKKLGLVYDPEPPYKILQTRKMRNITIEKVDRLLTMVYHFYNNINNRKKIQLISAIFNVPHHRIFELLSGWYRGSRKELLNGRSLNRISARFFSQFFGNSPARKPAQ